jgi:predicted RNA-binding protein YlqC (UPF0109 family)
MPNRISKLTHSVKQLGEIQVNEWDLMGLLNTDIKELKIIRSLRKLGNIQVMEWDFRTVLPAVNRVAHQEVDLVGFFRRAANYRVLEWDFRKTLPPASEPAARAAAGPAENRPGPAAMQEISDRLRNFLQYMVAKLTDEPNHAMITVTEIGPKVLLFRVVLVKRDVAMLIGRQGFTASAIRRILQAAAGINGVRAYLQILSYEEQTAPVAGKRTAR